MTVTDFTARAAGTYLQSAVFIDDQIFVQASGKAAESPEVSIRPRKAAFARDEVSPKNSTEPQSATTPSQSDTFHPKEIVGSFAQRGIVCALYEPAPNFATDEGSEIFKLSQAADLVILDWDFHKDDGEKMRELVTALVTQSSKTVPHHSRLIIIYTTTPSLQKVSSAIYDRLKQAKCEAEPADSALRLDAGPTRIVVLGKTGVERHNDEAGFSVAERDLAARVFNEFVLKNVGILSACALLGMAAIKRNSRRILAKFSSELDGAFLLHRALVLHNDDAFEMLPSLIAEEFLAVVEDHFATLGDVSSLINDKVEGLPVVAPEKKWRKTTDKPSEKGNVTTQELAPEEFAALIKKLLRQGVAGLKDERKCLEIKKLTEDGKSFLRAVDVSVMAALRKVVDSTDSKANERLAALLNSRTFYDQQSRFLTLGTVIRSSAGPPQYWMCLTPVCDSVRLRPDREYEFTFVKLSHGEFGQRSGNGFVLDDVKNELITLVSQGKVRDLFIEKFKADNAGVAAAVEEKGVFFFTAPSQTKYEWVGQLKPAHSQRIAHNIGQVLSRVGLSEAEWVRMLCDRESTNG